MFSFLMAVVLTGTSFVGLTHDQVKASHDGAALVQVERGDNGIAPAAFDNTAVQTVALPAPAAPAADSAASDGQATPQYVCFYRWVYINGYWYYQYICY